MSEMKSTNTQSNEMNARLKSAVKSAEVPPFLEARIRQHVQAESQPRKRWAVLAPAAAVAGLALVGLLGYQIEKLRQTAEQQESFIATVSARVSTLMRVGLGDHIHCAFFRKFPAEAPAKEEVESELGNQYQDIIPAVRQNVPEQYKLVLGHECRYNGRDFVHLSLKSDSQLLSVVITAKKNGETFDIEGALPELVHSGIPMYASTTDRFQIAAMETSSHLVYFISDLPREQNFEILRAMGPALKTILENIEG
jgi:hypothetical protein